MLNVKHKKNDCLEIIADNLNIKSLPLLKWAGGKRALLKHILPLIPKTINQYYEPFVGGGALFFNLQPRSTVLADSNFELINCYRQVRDNPNEVISLLSLLNNSERDYYRIRSEIPNDELNKAARLIYLTTLSFNGIYRLNLKGEFNVPYGYKMHIQPCNIQKIITASKTLNNVQLRCMDFEETVADARKGDLIYFDPPYTVAHGNNGFIKYNAKIFSWDDQIRLSKTARILVNRGCNVIISNAHHQSILEVYNGFKCKIIERTSIIAASTKKRRKVTECIFYNEG